MQRSRHAGLGIRIRKAPDMVGFIRLNQEAILLQVVRRKGLPVNSFEVKALFGEVLYKLCRADCISATQGYDATELAIYVDRMITAVLVRDLERDAAG